MPVVSLRGLIRQSSARRPPICSAWPPRITRLPGRRYGPSMERDVTGSGRYDESLSALEAALIRVGVAHDFRPGDPVDVSRTAGVLPLSPELMDFYAAAGAGLPEHIPAPLGEISLFPIAKLVDAQAGYRWNASTREPLDGWPAAWVVVAAQEGDPFIADTGTPGTPVGVAVHGSGAWQPHWVAPTFRDFLALLTAFTYGYVVDFLAADDDQTVDDMAYLTTVEARLQAIAPAVNAETFLAYLSL